MESLSPFKAFILSPCRVLESLLTKKPTKIVNMLIQIVKMSTQDYKAKKEVNALRQAV